MIVFDADDTDQLALFVSFQAEDELDFEQRRLARLTPSA
jgi:hypothetical protein